MSTAWWEITPQIEYVAGEIAAMNVFIERGEAIGREMAEHRADRLQLIAVRAALVEFRALKRGESRPLRRRPYLVELFTGWRRARG